MPLVTSYTEKELGAFMATVLQDVATTLGWAVGSTDAGSYQPAVNAALRAYGGVTTTAEATDMAKLEALARREGWRQVMHATAGDYDSNEDKVDLKRSQAHKQAVAQFQLASTAALPYDGAYKVGVGTRVYRGDPYTYLPDDARGATS